MLSSILVVRLGESTDDLFEYVTHLKIRDVVRMQIGLCGCKFLKHDVENILLCHRSDMTVKLKLFDDLLYIRRKSVQIIAEVRFNIVGIVKQTLKGVFACIIELISRNVAEQNIAHGQFFYLLIFCEYRIFCIRKNAIKTTNNRKRQNNLSIFVGFINSRQFICYRPNQIGFFIYM